MTISPATNSDLRTLTAQFAQNGQLDAIYLRPARNVPCVKVASTLALAGQGLVGDRTLQTPSRNPLGSNRQVKLIQA